MDSAAARSDGQRSHEQAILLVKEHSFIKQAIHYADGCALIRWRMLPMDDLWCALRAQEVVWALNSKLQHTSAELCEAAILINQLIN